MSIVVNEIGGLGIMSDIIGYTYKADNFTPKALIQFMVRIGELSPAALDDYEDALNQLAECYAINRDDEWSYDSDEFHKVILKFMDADVSDFVGYSDTTEYEGI